MRMLVGAGLLGLACVGMGAQETATAPAVKVPAFDVVSIKPNNSLSGSMRMSMYPDHFNNTNVSLKMMLQIAYGIRQELITGLPGWAEDAHFDMQGKVVEPDMAALNMMTTEERRPMFQAVLADRFKLKVHTETKVLSVYNMVLLKGEPKLTEVLDGGASTKDDPRFAGLSAGNMRTRRDGTTTELVGRAVNLTGLGNLLAGQVQRTVINMTGLTGKYDVLLKWTSEDDSGTPKPEGAEPGVSIFTALQEQLGVKLQAGKGPVETLVVDKVEMPTEN